MQPRLRSDIRVQAILCRASAAGGFGTVVRRGHEIAGVLFVKHTRPDQTAHVFSPPPGPSIDGDGIPKWMIATGSDAVSQEEADDYLARRAASDPDIWVVEIETGDGAACLDGPLEDPAIPSPETDPLISRVFGKLK